MSVKLYHQRIRLLFSWVKSVSVNLYHLFTLSFISIPIRRFALWANSDFNLSGGPLMPATFTKKFSEFNFHTYKYNLFLAEVK
jgi:hypothetical protein